MEQAELSRLLFGRAGRLRLAKWVLDNVPVGAFFFAAEAQQGTGDVPNEVKDNLARFVELGVITRAHREPGPGRRQYYERADSPIWTIFQEALQLTVDLRTTGDDQLISERPIGLPRASHGSSAR